MGGECRRILPLQETINYLTKIVDEPHPEREDVNHLTRKKPKRLQGPVNEGGLLFEDSTVEGDDKISVETRIAGKSFIDGEKATFSGDVSSSYKGGKENRERNSGVWW